MEDLKVRFCKLCLTTIHGENYETENVIKHIRNLGVTLLKGVDDSREHVTCNACSEKLLAALTFKSTCSYVDITISSYAQNTTVFPLDLREIYMKDRGSEHIMLDDIKICLLCMQTIKEIECKPINDGLVDMLQKFVPEMNVFIIKEPVMCKLCLDSLVLHCDFLRNVERNIGNISNNELLSNTTSATPSLDILVKIEEVEFEEDMPQLIKTECLDINCEEIKTESEIHEQGTSSEAAVKFNHEADDEVSPEHDISYEYSSTVQIYKCEQHESETKCKASLRHHIMLIDKDPSEVQIYKCEDCNFETNSKWSLKDHTLKHKDPLEVEMFKCGVCSFETNRKGSLKSHMLKHKDSSKVQVYKCEVCDYQTKFKGSFNRHILIHKDPTTVRIYNCRHCNYKSKLKFGLDRHMLTHKDPSEVQMYKCENCNFETNRKGNLKIHMLIHKDPSEVQMYKCESCSFRTKRKSDLKSHMLTHKDPSEVQMYKCDDCNYQTKFKSGLIRHILIHKDRTTVPIYSCKYCNYKSKLKIDLDRHMVMHKDS